MRKLRLVEDVGRLVPSPALKRFAVPVSVLLIVAYWATSAWTQLFRAGGATVPGSVRAIAGFVCIKTALAVAVVWTLLRAFVLTRFERALGRIGLGVAVVVDSAIFGLGHLYQGVTAAVQSGITGLLFALIFLKRRRAADSMVVHALFDLFGIALAYLLYAAKR